MTDWIIVPVVLPALVAALLLLALRGRLAAQRRVAWVSVLAQLLLAGALLRAAAAGPEAYFLGDWPAPFGIVLVLDRLAAVMLALTGVLSALVLAHVTGTGWDARGRHFHALFQFQIMGLNGAFLTGDAFNLFVFFEVLLIASYGLVIHGGGAQRLRAGVQYIAFNLVASGLFLVALALTYAVTGTLNLADLAVKVAALPAGDAALIRVAAVLMMLVFAIKGALVPLHFWLPGTYALAPGPVAALLAVMTKVGAYAVIRVWTTAFAAPATGPMIGELLMPAALLTLAVGAAGVLGARGLARQAAFATLASMGTLFIAVALGTAWGTAAALYYMIHSTLAGAALFLIADLVAARRGTDAWGGAARPAMAQAGLLGGFYMAAAAAAAGLPPLSGFVGKLMVMDAARGGWMPAVWTVILAGSLAMVMGFARAGSALFWKPGGAAAPHPPQPQAQAAVAVLLAALAGLTVAAGPVMDYLEAAAAGLHDPAAYVAAVLARAGE